MDILIGGYTVTIKPYEEGFILSVEDSSGEGVLINHVESGDCESQLLIDNDEDSSYMMELWKIED